MSSAVDVDVHELERFAELLKRYATELDEGKRHLVHRFALLEETWRDDAHEEFAGAFQLIIRSMDHLVAQTHGQAESLFNKVTALKRFLDIDQATTTDVEGTTFNHLAVTSGELFDSEETER